MPARPGSWGTRCFPSLMWKLDFGPLQGTGPLVTLLDEGSHLGAGNSRTLGVAKAGGMQPNSSSRLSCPAAHTGDLPLPVTGRKP